jgi:hypothetical protein
MRGTFFLVTRHLRPTIEAATRSSTDRINRTLDKARISSAEFQRLSKAIITSLSRGPKTLPEIKNDSSNTRLRTLDWRRGWRVTRRTNLGVVLQLLLLQHKVQSKPEAVDWKNIDWDGYGVRTFTRISKVTYEIVSPVPITISDVDKARAKLAELYVKRYGPVSVDDVAWWLDESKPSTYQLLDRFKERVVRIRINGLSEEFLVHKDDFEALHNASEDRIVTRFLPYEDAYSKGVKVKDRIVTHSLERQIYPMGNALPTVILGGRIFGTWSIVGRGKNSQIVLRRLARIPSEYETQVIEEGERLAGFLFEEGGAQVSIK